MDPATPPTPPTPPGGHGLRTGLGLATALVVLAIVVGVVAVVVVVHRVGDVVSIATRDVSPENPGAPDRLTVAEGDGFTFHQQRFQRGWRLTAKGTTVLRPQHLVFVGEDGSTTAAAGLLDLRLYRHDVLLGVSHCRSTDTLEPGSPNEMSCTSVVTGGGAADRIEVADFRVSNQ